MCGDLIGALPVECAWDTLERNTTVAANTVVKVLEDVYVPSGKTLTLEHGAQFLFDSVDESEAGVDAARNEIRVHGRLEVNGTPSAMVRFTSTDTVGADADSWFGIWTGSYGSADLTLATIHNARFGVYRSSGFEDVTIDSCEFSACETACVYGSLLTGDGDNHLTVRNSEIRQGAAPYGVWAEGLDRVVIDHNNIDGKEEDAGVYGVYIAVTSNPDTFQTEVTNNSIINLIGGTGVAIGSFSPAIHGAAVNNCKWGAQVFYDSTPSVDNSSFSGCTTGLYTGSTAAPVASGLTVENCATGIYADGTSKGTYMDVAISGTQTSTGVKAWSKKQGPGDATPGPVFLRGSILEFSSNGVLVDSTGFINLGVDSLEMGNNEIWSNAVSTPKYIQTITPRKVGLADIKAVYNFFGEYPPDSTRFGQHVIYLPALTEAPSKPGAMLSARTFAPPVSSLTLRASPNPFSSGVVLEIGGVPTGEESVLEIFDVSGRSVRRLPSSGSGRATWDGRDEIGRGVVSGLYFARLSYKGKELVKKIVRTW